MANLHYKLSLSNERFTGDFNMVNSELNVKPFRWFIYQNVKVRTTLKTGTIERWNGGMVEWWNGGMVEWWNGGMAEWRNGGMAEWRNGGK